MSTHNGIVSLFNSFLDHGFQLGFFDNRISSDLDIRKNQMYVFRAVDHIESSHKCQFFQG